MQRKLIKSGQNKYAKMKLAAVGAATTVALPVFAEGEASPTQQIFDAVDLTTVGAVIAAIGVVIIGIALGEKGVGIAKRMVRKA